jgi:hypothetical protein
VTVPSTCTTLRCARRAIAGGRCRRCYRYMQRHGHPPDLTGPQVGDPAGHGRYGRMERQQDSALCHECGGWYASVGSHIRQAHDLTAADYRARYGLKRGEPLVSLAMSQAASERSSGRVGSAAWRRLEARRDPSAASHTRDREAIVSSPAAAEGRRARAATNAASQAQPHPCAVCGGPIPGWRGTDDNRRQCGSAACSAESNRRRAQASARTRTARRAQP